MRVFIVYLAPCAIQMPSWRIKHNLIKAAMKTKLLIQAPMENQRNPKAIKKAAKGCEGFKKCMKHSHYIHHICVEMCPPTVPFKIYFGHLWPVLRHSCSSVKQLNMHGLTEVQKARRNKSNINVLSTKPNQYLFLSWNSLTSMSTVKPMLMLYSPVKKTWNS